MGYYIGIDPSISNTGVVVLDHNGFTTAIYNSKQGIKRGKTEIDIAFYVRRADEIMAFLQDAFDGPVNGLGYEDYSFDSIHRSYTLAEYGGILKSKLLAISNPRLLAPNTVKKFATGNGLASKDMMVAAAVAESPYIADLPGKQRTNDICDAYFMAKMSLYMANIRQPEYLASLETNKNMLRLRLNTAQRITSEAA